MVKSPCPLVFMMPDDASIMVFSASSYSPGPAIPAIGFPVAFGSQPLRLGLGGGKANAAHGVNLNFPCQEWFWFWFVHGVVGLKFAHSNGMPKSCR